MRNFPKNFIPKIFHRQFPWVFTKMSLTIHWSLWIFMYQCDNKDRNTTLKLFSSNEILRIFSQLFYNTKKTANNELVRPCTVPKIAESPHTNRVCHGWSRHNGICLVNGPDTVCVYTVLYVCTKARHIPCLDRLGFYSAPLLFSWKYK